MKGLRTVAAVAALLPGMLAEGQYVPSAEVSRTKAEFQDMKFGIFIHWGIYSMLGDGEWVMHNKNINYREYAELARGFFPSRFDASEWARAFKDAGARYVTFTSRHHDGFSMFHTRQSDYNIVDGTPFGRDVAKELADALRAEGLGLHFYYSHLDWGRTDYPLGRTGLGTGRPRGGQDWARYYDFMNSQLSELLTGYGRVDCIWFDGWWDHDRDNPPFDWRLDEQYALIHRLQPQCMVANNQHGAPRPGEDVQIFEQDLPGENTAGMSGQDISALPLETCLTMNNTWGYSITDKRYKSAETLIRALVRAAGRGANLLLNVGPRPDGRLPDEALERLRAVGEWLRANGETVYGTRAGVVAPHPWGVSTQKGDKLFLHILDLADLSLFVPMEGVKVKEAKTFASGKRVKVRAADGGYVLTLPERAEGVDYIVQLTVAN